MDSNIYYFIGIIFVVFVLFNYNSFSCGKIKEGYLDCPYGCEKWQVCSHKTGFCCHKRDRECRRDGIPTKWW